MKKPNFIKNYIQYTEVNLLNVSGGKFIRLLSGFSMISISMFGQATADFKKSLLTHFEDYRIRNYQEKIYLQTDKSLYVTGEILWCKAFITDAHLHQFSDISKVAYLELNDAQNKPIWQSSIGLESGEGEASVIIPSTAITGTYTLRGYTNLMKNQGPGFYFEKNITVINPLKKPQAPEAMNPPAAQMEFFPEGGHMVVGLPSHLAFRMIDQTGKIAKVNGWIITAQNDTICPLQTNEGGMGDVFFTPENGNQYRAIVQAPGGEPKEFPLPQPEQNGYTMQLSGIENGEPKLSVFTNLLTYSNQCYLLIHCRQTNLKFLSAVIEKGRAEFIINEKELSDGISHFTVFNDQQKPVLERLYFKQPEKIMQIDVKGFKQNYQQKERVDISLTTLLPGGLPTPASFAISVVKMDTPEIFNDMNIINYLYMQSDIPEKIESPGQYLKNSTIVNREITNLLMLTYGWRRFRWESMNDSSTNQSRYIAEYSGPVISAKMTNKNGQSAPPGLIAYATIPGNRYETVIAKTNSQGELQFLFNQHAGTGTLAIQPAYKKDSSWQLSLLSPYSTQFSAKTKPIFPFTSKDSSAISELVFTAQLQSAFRKDGDFAYQPIFKSDTTSFYGLPDKNYYLDDYTKFNTLEEVFREYIPDIEVRKNKGNFKLYANNLPYKSFFKDDPLILVDGIPVSEVDKVMAFAPQLVKNISVVAHRYYASGLTFPGIISLQTYTGDLGGFTLDPRVLLVDFDGLQVKREFNSPGYEKQSLNENRLPDLRSVLFWSPSNHTNNDGKSTFSFYTSDLKGKFALIIEGLNDKGYPGSTIHYFDVQ